MKAIIFILLLPALSAAQSISASHTSVRAWGKAMDTAHLSVSYKSFTLIGMHTHTNEVYYDPNGKEYKGDFIGLFYHPFNISTDRFFIKGGSGLLNRKFPTPTGNRLNFRLETGIYLTDWLGISYSHMSNGFGLWSDINTGVDHISVILNINGFTQ